MAKLRSRFVCQECGDTKPQPLGRCSECGGWNTYVEEAIKELAVGPRAIGGARRAVPVPISEVSGDEQSRFATGIDELDRVLGGGVVPGSLILIGGEPGAGKSTLTMQIARQLSLRGRRVLYVSGEESAMQIRLRAIRLGAETSGFHLLAETDMDAVVGAIEEMRPDWVVVDSIQAVHDTKLGSPPGGIAQVREAAGRLMRLAKGQGIAICLVGHVTKEGTLAGPRVLEHLVDTVLSFEGDRFRSYRLLRAVKNRFGSTQEVGVFEMTGGGLVEVPNPSALFLAERAPDATGSAIAVPMEGTRPLLVEVQALVAPTFMPSPRRATTGVDAGRLVQILAVLERRVGLPLSKADVYISVVGGMDVAEPAGDLAVALAIASGVRDVPLAQDLVAIGEIGLGGEVRSVSQVEARLRESAKLGFKRAIVPAGNVEGLEAPPGMTIVPVGRLMDALLAALPAPASAGPMIRDPVL